MLEARGHVYELKEGVALRQVEDAGRYWVFNTRDGRHYSVNREAYQVIKSIAAEGVADVETLAELLAEEYEVTAEVAQKDVEQLLADLVNEGIALRRDKP
ncbi:MAG: PqqD family protein [Firmicutes bacterium]|nr:PqqD family protein [Bacillota bacterium]